MRIVKNPDERKQEILDAAVRVFARKGYERTSIADIAKEIGISQGLCYRYYKSKEEMYDAAVDEYASYIASQNIKRAENGVAELTLKEQIRQMSGELRAYANMEQGKSELYELFHREENHKMHDALTLKTCEKLVPYLAGILREAVRRGEIQIADPEASAYFCVYGQMGLLMSKTYPEEEKREKIQSCLFELLGIK